REGRRVAPVGRRGGGVPAAARALGPAGLRGRRAPGGRRGHRGRAAGVLPGGRRARAVRGAQTDLPDRRAAEDTHPISAARQADRTLRGRDEGAGVSDERTAATGGTAAGGIDVRSLRSTIEGLAARGRLVSTEAPVDPDVQ